MNYQLFKRSNGVYYLKCFDSNGNEVKRITTKQKNKSLALQFLRGYEESTTEKTTELTCKTAFKRYLDYKKERVSKSHYNRSLKVTEKFFTQSFGNNTLKEIAPHKVEQYLIDIFKNSKYSASLQYRVLKNFFNWSIDNNYTNFNPLIKIKLPKIEKKFPAFINQTELEIICTNTENETMKDIFRFLFFTGIRLSELINLQIKDIDFENRILTVSIKKDFSTKSKRERVIPLNEIAFNITHKYRGFSLNPNQYIFTKKGFKYNPAYISKTFKRIIRNLGMNENLHLHSLRHSFCSNLVNKGIDLYTVKELAGHQNIITTQIYSHLQTDSLRNAINQL